MPTLPPKPSEARDPDAQRESRPHGSREPESHEAREVAESFGSDAERYDRARPTYPAALIERIAAPAVLDVGCGTGIVARQLQAAGSRVLGVDPDPRMAEYARQYGIEVEVATFERWEPAGRQFDAVVAGQSWHWIDPAVGAARAAAVLRPGGRLAVFWNAFQLPSDVEDRVAEVYRRVLPDAPPYQRLAAGPDGYLQLVAKVTTAMDGFSEREQWRFDWERAYTRAEWLDQVPTFGGFGQLSSAHQDELLAGIGAAIDDAGGGFTMSYSTVVATAVR